MPTNAAQTNRSKELVRMALSLYQSTAQRMSALVIYIYIYIHDFTVFNGHVWRWGFSMQRERETLQLTNPLACKSKVHMWHGSSTLVTNKSAKSSSHFSLIRPASARRTCPFHANWIKLLHIVTNPKAVQPRESPNRISRCRTFQLS